MKNLSPTLLQLASDIDVGITPNAAGLIVQFNLALPNATWDAE